MRKLTLRLIAASITFALGLMVSSFSDKPVDLASIEEIAVPPFEAEHVCEIHGAILQKARVRSICGVFKDGGYSLSIGCKGAQNYQISREDAMFFFHENGGLSRLQFWKDYDEAEQSQFPHGLVNYSLRVCEANEADCETIEVCPPCRAAELLWRRKALQNYGL